MTMSIKRRLDTIEAAMNGGACVDCGYPHTCATDFESPHDGTIGGCCPSCRRLLNQAGQPFGDYWSVGFGDRLELTDAGLVWRCDGLPITGPGHPVKVLPQVCIDAV